MQPHAPATWMSLRWWRPRAARWRCVIAFGRSLDRRCSGEPQSAASWAREPRVNQLTRWALCMGIELCGGRYRPDSSPCVDRASGNEPTVVRCAALLLRRPPGKPRSCGAKGPCTVRPSALTSTGGGHDDRMQMPFRTGCCLGRVLPATKHLIPAHLMRQTDIQTYRQTYRQTDGKSFPGLLVHYCCQVTGGSPQSPE